MAMRIDSSYNNYPINRNSQTKTDITRKTAADELAYLKKKYDGYSFVAADFKPGMRYGSNTTTNVAISPQFLKKMANDPELEQKYEKEIENMQRLDKQIYKMHEAQGSHIIVRGWAIDKDGGISSWTIGTRDDRRIKVKSPTDYALELYEKKKEKGKIVLKHKTNTAKSKPSMRFDKKA